MILSRNVFYEFQHEFKDQIEILVDYAFKSRCLVQIIMIILWLSNVDKVQLQTLKKFVFHYKL